MTGDAVSESMLHLDGHEQPRKRLSQIFTGLFVLLMIAVILIVFLFFRSLTHIDDTTSYFHDTILPKSAAAYELKISLNGAALNVLQYLNEPKAGFREQFAENRRSFLSFLETYRTHVQNEREDVLYNEMKRMFEAFTAEGTGLIAAKDVNTANFDRIKAVTGGTYRIVESDLRVPTDQLGELQEALRLASLIDHGLDELVTEVTTHSEYGLSYYLDRLKNLNLTIDARFLDLYNLPIAANHAKALIDMRANSDDMVKTVEQIIRVIHQINSGVDRLIEVRRGIDRSLDQGIQDIAIHQLVGNTIETKAAIWKATEVFIVSIVVIILIVILLAVLFTRKVLRPIAALTQNVEAYGRGELSTNVNIAQRDEIGFLAGQFAAMAKRLSKSQASLNDANANLESKVAARTEEVSAANRALVVELERRTRIEERLRQVSREALQANRAKTAFLANMSHELRTPLNAILGFSEIMAFEMFGGLGNSRYKEYATDIQNSGKYLKQLIEDLLSLGAIEEGRLELSEEAFDPLVITEEVLQLVHPQASGAQIGISSRSNLAGARLIADRRHIKQVLINLVVNAVKFTEAGGRILIRWRMRNDSIELSVIDTGVGIPQQRLESLFARYNRGDRSVSHGKEGVGLGLALVKGIADAHGAEIFVNSRVGHGTSITVRFPSSSTQYDEAIVTRATASC